MPRLVPSSADSPSSRSQNGVPSRSLDPVRLLSGPDGRGFDSPAGASVGERLSLLVPYRREKHREESLKFVVKRATEKLPGIEVCVGTHRLEEGHFAKGVAVNRAAKAATRDIFLICDADLIFPAWAIEEAMSLLSTTSWVVPFMWYVRLSQRQSQQVLSGNDFGGWESLVDPNSSAVYKAQPGGGIVMVTREAFESVGGIDPRFAGWGCEDNAFAVALTTLCGGPGWIPATILHLWHPRARQASVELKLYEKNKALLARYLAARRNPEAIRKLIAEWRQLNEQDKGRTDQGAGEVCT